MPTSPARGVRVKFCGMRRAQDVRVALELGVDYIGFVLVPGSVRGVEEDDVLRVLDEVDCSGVCRVGVFRDAAPARIELLVRRLSLDLVQLHGREAAALAERLPVPVIRALPVPEQGAGAGERFEASILPRTNLYGVLFDAAPAQGQGGGRGRRADAEAMESLQRLLPAELFVFVAGGLTPENVGAIVERHRPDAVDVSSGIEARPGEKDPARMRAFLAAVTPGGGS